MAHTPSCFAGDPLPDAGDDWQLCRLKTRFATLTTESSSDVVVQELVDMLATGRPSVDLQGFLAREMTTRKLKALRTTMEQTYSQLQALATENLKPVVERLIFRLCSLLGLARWQERFGGLGLQTARVRQAEVLAEAVSVTSLVSCTGSTEVPRGCIAGDGWWL